MDDQEMEEPPSSWPLFECFEIDLDYELDAPKYFDFSREESPAEIWAKECWLGNAAGYPTSPLLAKETAENDVPTESTNIFSNLDNLDYPNTSNADQHAAITGSSVFHDNKNEWMSQATIMQDLSQIDKKCDPKKIVPTKSTLMKPTASQLAKQNRLRQTKHASRFQKQVEVKMERIHEDLIDHSHQAPKRQKLERGHFCKEVGVSQPYELFHKVPGKMHEMPIDIQNNVRVDLCTPYPKLKLTIPREPELQTARRALALRVRQLRSESAKPSMEENPLMPTSTMFKARSLNKKILEAPSLPYFQKSTPKSPKFKEFNFKTQDRVIRQRTTETCTLVASCQIPYLECDQKRFLGTVNQSSGLLGTENQSSENQQQLNYSEKTKKGDDMPLNFRARSLNKKTFASKGDIGVSGISQLESTKHKEFSYSTNQKSHRAPLSVLFNKLNLSANANAP